uniref:Glycosyltransferase n=1 Tax=Fagus sylvatica TaxID=28930 RepID=A0A2N9EZ04_FAGSY
MTNEELLQLPPGYPCLSELLINKEFEIAQLKGIVEDMGTGMSLYLRTITGMTESDAMAFRTYNELEGPYRDYIRQHYAKPVLLTGPVMPQTLETKLDERWANWLSNFEQGNVVYCAFGSQIKVPKEQFQELLLGFELCGQPFLVALSNPYGCATIEEALPEGFEERVKGRGLVYGGWMPQTLILEHKSVGCFVTHCGYGSMWESLLSDCQIVCVPHLGDQILDARLMAGELKVAVEVERENNGWVSKESLSEAIISVMDKDSEVGGIVKYNHAKLKEKMSRGFNRGRIYSEIEEDRRGELEDDRRGEIEDEAMLGEVRSRSWASAVSLGLCMLPRRSRVRVRVWMWVWSRLKLRVWVWVANVNVRGLEGKMGRELLVEVVVGGGVGGGWMGIVGGCGGQNGLLEEGEVVFMGESGGGG